MMQNPLLVDKLGPGSRGLSRKLFRVGHGPDLNPRVQPALVIVAYRVSKVQVVHHHHS